MAETSLRCPQCGAPARSEEADDFATCRFCGARLLLAAEPGVRHEVLSPALRADEMPVRLRTWLEEREALGTASDVTSRVVFVPFWSRSGGAGEAIAPAAALLSSGLDTFKLPAGDAKSFGPDLARVGTVVPVTVDREAVFADVPLAELRLVHVPFHEVSFRLFGRTVRVLFDAVAGQALPLDPVPTSESRLDSAYAILLAILFAVAFVGFFSLFRGQALRGLGLLVLGGPALVLATREIVVRMEEA